MFWRHRVTEDHIEFFLRVIERRFPSQSIVMLHDGAVTNEDDERWGGSVKLFINCAHTPASQLDTISLEENVFLYACSWSSNGLPWIRKIVHGGGKFLAIGGPQAAPWVDQNDAARRVMDFEFARQTQEGYAKFDHPDFVELCQVLYRTRHIAGDIVEIGCFEGSSGSLIAHYLSEIGLGRRCWFFDVFEGFNYEAARSSSDTAWVGGHIVAGGRDRVAARLERYANPTIGLQIEVRQSNIITDPLPPEISKIAVANIDVDIYDGVLAALHKVRPLLARGGIILAEDPSHTPGLVGALLAVDEFMESDAGKGLFRYQLPSAQTMLINMG